jgi:hypothetical protein
MGGNGPGRNDIYFDSVSGVYRYVSNPSRVVTGGFWIDVPISERVNEGLNGNIPGRWIIGAGIRSIFINPGFGVESDGEGGRTPNLSNFQYGLGIAGYGTEAVKYAAQSSAQTTVRYGQRVNGVVKSSAQLTKEGSAFMGKLATRLNVLGATIGIIDGTIQGVDDFKNENYGFATFEFSKVAGYTTGILLIAISPLTGGSTAIIGGYIIAGTSAVDIAGDVGFFIFGRN